MTSSSAPAGDGMWKNRGGLDRGAEYSLRLDAQDELVVAKGVRFGMDEFGQSYGSEVPFIRGMGPGLELGVASALRGLEESGFGKGGSHRALGWVDEVKEYAAMNAFVWQNAAGPVDVQFFSEHEPTVLVRQPSELVGVGMDLGDWEDDMEEESGIDVAGMDREAADMDF